MKTKNKTKLILWLILGLTYFSFFGMVLVNVPFTIMGVFLTQDPNYIISVPVAEISTGIYRMLEAILFTLVIRISTFPELFKEKFNKKAFVGILLAFSYSAVYYMITSPAHVDYAPTHFIRTLLISPIFEELMFRGAIQRTLKNVSGPKFAIITTTIIFSLYHFDKTQSLFVIPLSLIFGYLAQNYSLKAAILAHMAGNSISLLYYLSPSFVTLLGISGIIAIIVILILKRKSIVNFCREKVEKGSYKKALLNLPMVLIMLTFILVLIGS